MKIAIKQFLFFSHILESDPTLEKYKIYCCALVRPSSFTVKPIGDQAVNHCIRKDHRIPLLWAATHRKYPASAPHKEAAVGEEATSGGLSPSL
jgi:hypothetical protein